MIRTVALSGLLALAAFGAAAETTLYYREGQRVEPQDVRRILDNVDAAPTRSRSIRLLGEARAEGTGGGATDTPNALALPVQFEFDSAAILPSAREQLDALAQGIKMLPPERRVIIEGHTDASGSDEYNQQLSRRRAAAVKHYLVEQHGIPAGRLRDVGLGERAPIADVDPYAGENRRVQFRGG